MKDSTLYIIGNGFDLFHGLKSSYKDYSEFAKINTPNVEEFLEVYFPQKTKTIGGLILKKILRILMRGNFMITMITFLKDLWNRNIHSGAIILEY